MRDSFRFKRPSADALLGLYNSKQQGIMLRGSQPALLFIREARHNPIFGSAVGIERIRHNRFWLYKNGNFHPSFIGAKSIWFKKT